MKSDIEIVSHWKDHHENSFFDESSPLRIQQDVPAILPNETSAAYTQYKVKKSSGNLLNKLFPNVLHTVEWRQKVVRRNFLNDFFSGFAFVYPITVSTLFFFSFSDLQY